MEPSIHHEIHRLLAFALQQGLVGEDDCVYAGNQLAGTLGLFDFEPAPSLFLARTEKLETPTAILETLMDDAVRRGVLGNTPVARDSFDTRLMNCLTPRPSEVIARFWADYDELPDKATENFHRFGIASNHIRKTRVDANEIWDTPTSYGNLRITINLSKPENDPRDITAERRQVASGYPRCRLCRENEGFFGTSSHPARHTLRLIPLLFRGERWFFQYSPYAYYNEHCIVLKEQHEPMRISGNTFDNLLSFLRIMPHYMIGSNADLPIVGGAILSHDHYQGGRHVFPLELAEVEKIYSAQNASGGILKDTDGVTVGRVNWPIATLRLRSRDRRALVEQATRILDGWRAWSDADAGIFAETNENGQTEKHNTITPIARMRGDEFELDLALRNNRTSREHPLGIYHPHADVHHIKKENIGLIEVMGLAVLPARLKGSLAGLAAAWIQNRNSVDDSPELAPHAQWYAQLRETCIGSPGEVGEVFRQEVGKVFLRVLEDCGVFARNEKGMAAFDRFVKSL